MPRGEKLAILGGYDWRDDTTVKLFLKELASNTIVLLDDDTYLVQSVALRQCRCAHLVAVVYRYAGGVASKAAEARRQRDEVMLGDAERVVVFGTLAVDRDLTLRAHEESGLSVRRIVA